MYLSSLHSLVPQTPQWLPDKLHILLTSSNLSYLHGLCLVHCFDRCLRHGSCCKSHKCTTWGKSPKGTKSFTTYTLLWQIQEWKCLFKKKKNHRNSWNAALRCKRQHPEENSQKGSCLPRLSPSGPRNILHSSICPKGENITRISFSLHFFDIIPINNFLSSTAKKSKDKSITRQACTYWTLFCQIFSINCRITSPLIRAAARQSRIPNNGILLF